MKEVLGDRKVFMRVADMQRTVESGIVQKVQAYIAPKLFGGQTAKTPIEGTGVPSPAGAFRLKNSRITRLGEDLLIESEVLDHVYRDR